MDMIEKLPDDIVLHIYTKILKRYRFCKGELIKLIDLDKYSFLEKYLADIIPDEKNVEYIIEYLKSKRETKKTPDLKRIFKKGMKRGTAKARESSGYESDTEL